MTTQKSPSRTSKLLRGVARPFLAGLLALLPLALTVGIVLWIAGFVQAFLGPDSILGRLLGTVGLAFATNERIAYVIGLGVALAAIYALGVLVEAGMKQRWQEFTDGAMRRLPFVSRIYDTAKRLLDMFSKKEDSELKAMSPVVCFFGGEGGTAVLALMPTPERLIIGGHAYHAVLIPSAPVPFGGGLLYVPADWVTPAGFNVEGLLNIYVSMGIASSQYFKSGGVAAHKELKKA